MWPIVLLVLLGVVVVGGAVVLGALIAERVILDGLNRRPPARFYLAE